MNKNTVLANSTATNNNTALTAQQKRRLAIQAKDTRTEAQKAEAEAKRKAEAEAEAKKVQLIAEAQKKAEAEKKAIEEKNAKRAKAVEQKKAEAKAKAEADAKKKAEAKKEAEAKAEAKKKARTTYEMIEAEAQKLSSFITVQRSSTSTKVYARICFTDNYKKDNYRLLKDFAIYYNKDNKFEISIADNLLDCKVFKETHVKEENKTKELKFTIEADKLHDTLFELVAQRIAQTDKVVYYSKITAIKAKAQKQTKSTAKAK